jgi:hypothetical protein
MTPIGVERRAECHAGSRAVCGPAPSFFLVALMERYGTTVSVTARRRRPLALNRGSERALIFRPCPLALRPCLVRLAGRRRAVSEASAILLRFTFALDSDRFLGGG